MRYSILILFLLVFASCGESTPESHYKKFKAREQAEAEVEAEKARQAKADSSDVSLEEFNAYENESQVLPFELSGYSGERGFHGYNFYHNGIRYIGIFFDNHAENSAAVVDYSQFFEKDTIMVNGRTWVALQSQPQDEEE